MKPLALATDPFRKRAALAASMSAKLRKPELNGRAGVVASADGVRELYLYDAIGGWWSGITADWLRAELDAVKAQTKRLNIFVNSPGGDVFEAKAMFALLQRFPGEKVVYIDGLAASAATFLVMAADRIVTAPHATWMIHEAWGGAMGNAAAMRDYADLLEMVTGDIAGIYAARTKQPLDKLRELMAAETWMTADQAKELAFTDSVATFTEDNAPPASEPAPAGDTTAAAVLTSTRARLAAFRAQRSMRREPNDT